MKSKKILFGVAALIVIGILAYTFWPEAQPQDEYMQYGMTADQFPQADEDYYKEMDGGVNLTTDEVKGRNTWMVYTAGNEAFWNYIAGRSFGTVDLLKIVTSYPDARYGRDNRFDYFGLINEPGFEKASEPGEYGLWLDKRTGSPDPFENADKYPGLFGSSAYGMASGVVGLRLFPNPEFDEEAAKKWDAEKYFTDRDYYYDKELKRPLRVGMTCAFCHVGPNPERPPLKVEKPEWSNLSTNVGSQYFWIGRVFGTELEEDNFVWQLLNSSPPGALETSMIATDNINNPRTMNAIYNVGERLQASTQYPKEKLTNGNLDLTGVESEMHVPHVLKDGADAVGVLGALTRVYFNIGAFHQEWVRHFNPILGGKPQTPIKVTVSRENSVSFQLTEQKVENLAKFFVKAATPHRLSNAPGGEEYLTKDSAVLRQGKIVFAQNCASCHSSKQPPANISKESPEYTDWMTQAVLKEDFLDNNYLSDEKRYPVSEIGTNAAAALASNALEGHIWEDFSSQTYKDLPGVGTIEYYDPFEKMVKEYEMPAGGRGYYRTPSLVSLWSTAPFFHNNGLGKFTNDPSVAGRMEAFDDAATKLLWPEQRLGNILIETGEYPETDCEEWGLPFCAPIYRTTKESWIVIHRSFLPDILSDMLEEGEEEVRIGPIPKGTPVNLLANIDLEIKLGLSQIGKHRNLVGLLINIKRTLRTIWNDKLSTEESTELLRGLVPDLYSVSKCPDFIVDRGHEFGSDLSDEDKLALIEFLKTF